MFAHDNPLHILIQNEQAPPSTHSPVTLTLGDHVHAVAAEVGFTLVGELLHRTPWGHHWNNIVFAGEVIEFGLETLVRRNRLSRALYAAAHYLHDHGALTESSPEVPALHRAHFGPQLIDCRGNHIMPRELGDLAISFWGLSRDDIHRQWPNTSPATRIRLRAAASAASDHILASLTWGEALERTGSALFTVLLERVVERYGLSAKQ